MVLLYQKQPWFAEYHYFCYMKFSRYTGAFYPNIIMVEVTKGKPMSVLGTGNAMQAQTG